MRGAVEGRASISVLKASPNIYRHTQPRIDESQPCNTRAARKRDATQNSATYGLVCSSRTAEPVKPEGNPSNEA